MKFINIVRHAHYLRLFRIIAILILAFSVSALFREMLEIKQLTPRNPSHQDKFFDHLKTGLKNNLFTEEYCSSAFRHFDNKSNGKLQQYGYPELLEAFIVHIASKPDSLLVKWHNPVAAMIRDAREQQPYASLPPDERRLLQAVQLSIARADSLNGLHQLNELRQLLADRHREYSRIEQQNELTVPLASAGLAATLVLGIWTIVLSFKGRKQPERDTVKRT